MLVLQLAEVLPQTLAQHLSSMFLLAQWDVSTGGKLPALTPAFLSAPSRNATSITASQLGTGGPHKVEHCSPSHPKPAWFGSAASSHTHSLRDNTIPHLFSLSNGLDLHKV